MYIKIAHKDLAVNVKCNIEYQYYTFVYVKILNSQLSNGTVRNTLL